MAQKIRRLSFKFVQNARVPGRFADGAGLYLQVSGTGSRSWVFIYRSPVHRKEANGKLVGRTREMGLGSASEPSGLSLAQARERADAIRRILAEGADPLDRASGQSQTERQPTFREVYEEILLSLEEGWRNDKHRAQWRMTLNVYAKQLHKIRIDEITTGHVLAVLSPIWSIKPETASRTRGRIERIIDAAKARGYRTGDNPARWRGHLETLLPKRTKLARGHHPAMPWREVPSFVARLRASASVSNLALEFLILTACRSGEILASSRDGIQDGARWDEIDFENCLWTVPATRMKAGKPHRVPLSARAVEILNELVLGKRGEFIFCGVTRSAPLSNMALELQMRRLGVKPYTVHGFRSSFRDWAGETTDHSRETCEAALAHTVGNAVELAYRREDSLQKRRKLMADWERFIQASSDTRAAQDLR